MEAWRHEGMKVCGVKSRTEQTRREGLDETSCGSLKKGQHPSVQHMAQQKQSLCRRPARSHYISLFETLIRKASRLRRLSSQPGGRTNAAHTTSSVPSEAVFTSRLLVRELPAPTHAQPASRTSTDAVHVAR